MRRLRTSYHDDWEDMEALEQPHIPILGVAFHPILLLGLMIVAVIVLAVVASLTQMEWFPQSAALRWSVLGGCVVGMLGVAVVSVISARTMTRAIRRSRMQLARLDGATPEEARWESDRFIRNNLYFRLAVYVGISLALWVILGSPWVFDWAGTLPYLCGIAVFLTLFILYASGLANRFWGWLRYRVAGR